MAKSDSSHDATSTNSLPSWLSNKRILIGWICVFFLLAFVSFFIFVPIVMSKEDSVGQCMLYADEYGFGHISVCDYCISIVVLFLIMCVARAAFRILELTKYSSRLTSTFLYSPVVKCVIVLLDLVVLLLLLVVASLISAGFSRLCELFHDRSECDSDYGVSMLPSDKVNYTYYDQLSVAQGAAWFAFCVWILVVIVEILIFWKEGSLQETTLKAKGVFGKSSPEV